MSAGSLFGRPAQDPQTRATPGHEGDSFQQFTRRGGACRSRPGAWSSVMALLLHRRPEAGNDPCRIEEVW